MGQGVAGSQKQASAVHKSRDNPGACTLKGIKYEDGAGLVLSLALSSWTLAWRLASSTAILPASRDRKGEKAELSRRVGRRADEEGSFFPGRP